MKLLPKNFLNTSVGKVYHQKLKTTKLKKEQEKKPKKIVINEAKVQKRPKKPNISVNQKKENYIQTLAPVIQEVYKQLQKKYNTLLSHIQQRTTSNKWDQLKKEYKVTTDTQLLKALKPHPVSIVLAQGAMESAWLTSRFAKDANNIFGVWSFNKKEPRIAAGGSRKGKVIYLKKYSSIKHAVEDYYKSIAKSWAYDELREKRIYMSNPYELLPTLEKYSEKGLEYTKILAKIIQKNNFEKYDIKD